MGLLGVIHKLCKHSKGGRVRKWQFWLTFSAEIYLHREEGALCVQMDFMRTFETTTKCNNINHFWSHFYKILVVLKYHRHPWANIFGTDISRCINTYFKVLAFLGMFMLLQKILAPRHLWYFKTDIKHDLYCCIWWWFEMSA